MNTGESYYITGQFPDMKRARLLGDGTLVNRKVHAVVFVIDTEEKRGKVETYIEELRTHHPEAIWKTRKV